MHTYTCIGLHNLRFKQKPIYGLRTKQEKVKKKEKYAEG